jgi:hypothetical protein
MLGLLFVFLVKLGLMILPLTVFFLAGRRLLLSRSANAWLYAAAALIAWVTALGLTPWTLGFGATHPVFFVFAAMTPALWYAVASLCNASHHMRYDSDLERTFLRLASMLRPAARRDPLVLEGADWPDAPKPVFRHSRPGFAPDLAGPGAISPPTQRHRASEATARLIEITRTMRRNRTSEDRRIKLLPPPERSGSANLPFLNPASST